MSDSDPLTQIIRIAVERAQHVDNHTQQLIARLAFRLETHSQHDQGTHIEAAVCLDESKQEEDPFATIPWETPGGRLIGRYRIVRLLGAGAFGKVWLAIDEELKRRVAIKVPTLERIQQPSDAEMYLTEARTLASLDHPNIVPVYDVGRAEDGSVYVVSKFIEGCNLAEHIKLDRLSLSTIKKYIAAIAQALEHAHQKRLIHRDIKPANILIEAATDQAFLTDFGLAVREEDYLGDSRLAGTPTYMSPEQASGEGHRLDGRSDIFSLGVVLYRLLTGQQPFRGNSLSELVTQVRTVDPPAPRELEPAVPLELERICLKALSKRASDRYATALELAQDLLDWQPDSKNAGREITVTPRGLRSFSAEDAHFFTNLLPGPRSREGLPQSIQFWKSKIEEPDPEKSFSVGVLFGPSGCGKSSLVKAGLLPRLSNRISHIYLEATVEQTEARILSGLRNHYGKLSKSLELVECMAAVRREKSRKLVLIIDQFEQWLHANQTRSDAELIEALRQCDGVNLQAILMVRDDFSMAIGRFMKELDIRIVEGQNFATVDLFDEEHATRVLVRFGRAFGKLPERTEHLSDAQREFVSKAVAGLAQDGRVIPVRLALFAEMVKAKIWSPDTLNSMGGVDLIGVRFLDETFCGRSANPVHRRHEMAARGVLKTLLPEIGTDLKGHIRSKTELLETSGYQGRADEFDELISALDGELRLITPTDTQDPRPDTSNNSMDLQYQLTHDYLVPSLRRWLTQKQNETRRGRAELKLAERASLWNEKRENRYLPSLLESVSIALLTDRGTWTSAQRAMMKNSQRFYTFTGGVAAALVAIAIVGALLESSRQRETYQRSLVKNLAKADIDSVPGLLKELAEYRVPMRFVDDGLASTTKEDEKLRFTLALAAHDQKKRSYLLEELLKADPAAVPVIGDVLARNNLPLFVAELRDRVERNELDPALESTNGIYEKSVRKGQRLANAAIALVRSDDKKEYREILRVHDDPEAITQFVHRCRTARVLATDLWSCVKDQLAWRDKQAIADRGKENQLLFGLLLALGEYSKDEVDPDAVNKVASLFRSDSSAAVHGATGWLLRHWQRSDIVDEIEQAPKPYDPSREWFRLTIDAKDERSLTYTFVVFPAGRYTIGSPKTEPDHDTDEPLRNVEIGYPFAVLDREITVRELLAFDPTFFGSTVPLESDLEKAGGFVNWRDAVKFCQWLTERNEIAGTHLATYEASTQSPQIKRFEFRLPLDAEWEIACRGGMATMYSCGSDVDLLKHYAWYDKFEAGLAARTLRPNFCGLFDMHGNVFEWCNDDFESRSGSPIDSSIATTETQKVLRSGAWHYAAVAIRSANRSPNLPLDGRMSFGFRPAVTVSTQPVKQIVTVVKLYE